MKQQSTHISKVYVVQHMHMLSTGDEEVKLIGVYSKMTSAHAACDRLRLQPGFAENQAGFSIDEYEIDKDQWTEGFFTIDSTDQDECCGTAANVGRASAR